MQVNTIEELEEQWFNTLLVLWMILSKKKMLPKDFVSVKYCRNIKPDFVSVKYCRNIKPKSDFAVIILVK